MGMGTGAGTGKGIGTGTGMGREDVVAELILMVNPLNLIMSVAMLNYEWCLALRSVLGTSGVMLRSSHPRQVSIIVLMTKLKKLRKRWGIYCPLQFGDFFEISEVYTCKIQKNSSFLLTLAPNCCEKPEKNFGPLTRVGNFMYVD